MYDLSVQRRCTAQEMTDPKAALRIHVEGPYPQQTKSKSGSAAVLRPSVCVHGDNCASQAGQPEGASLSEALPNPDHKWHIHPQLSTVGQCICQITHAVVTPLRHSKAGRWDLNDAPTAFNATPMQVAERGTWWLRQGTPDTDPTRRTPSCSPRKAKATISENTAQHQGGKRWKSWLTEVTWPNS